MSKKKPSLKTLGLIATVGGFGLSLLGSWVGEQKQEKLIEEKVTKALADREKK